MKLSLRGTPRTVAATLIRIDVDIQMTDVEVRMLELSMKCQEKAGKR